MSTDRAIRPALRGPSGLLPVLLALLSTLTLAALLVGGALAEAAFAVLAALLPVVLIAVATRNDPRLRPLLAALGLVLAGSALAVWWLPADGAPASYRLGLPIAAWVALVGLGLVPFVIVVLGHALSFRNERGRGRRDG